jgi:hypothetical protein
MTAEDAACAHGNAKLLLQRLGIAQVFILAPRKTNTLGLL